MFLDPRFGLRAKEAQPGLGTIAVALFVVAAIVASACFVLQLTTVTPAGATCSAATYDCAVLNDNPLGYWRLDETSGSTMMDAISNNRTPGAYGSATTLGVPGLVNGGINAGPDAGTAVSLGNGMSASGSALSSTDFSFEFWIGQSGGGLDQVSQIAAFGPVSFNQSATYDCSVSVKLSDGTSRSMGGACDFMITITNSLGYVDSTGPHHVVYTQDHSNAYLYVDGAVAGSVATSGLNVAGSDWRFVNLGGFVDNAAWYGSALSPSKVNSHYMASYASRVQRTLGPSSSYVGYSDDPVNTATGGFSHAKTLVPYPSNVYGLTTTATFNRLDTNGRSILGLGLGWTSDLDSAVNPLADGSVNWRVIRQLDGTIL